MQNKLQELTDKLYREGLSKGQSEAQQLLLHAKEEAASIVAKAKEEAAQLLLKAQKSATEAKKNAEGEMKLAGRQTMASVKQAIEDLLTTKIIAEPTKAAMSDAEFLKSLIKAMVERFNAQTPNAPLLVMLPEAMRQSLQSFAEEQTQNQLLSGLDIQFEKSFKAGFKIGSKANGYHISLTDKDFSTLFGEFLRPYTRAFLFGE